MPPAVPHLLQPGGSPPTTSSSITIDMGTGDGPRNTLVCGRRWLSSVLPFPLYEITHVRGHARLLGRGVPKLFCLWVGE